MSNILIYLEVNEIIGFGHLSRAFAISNSLISIGCIPVLLLPEESKSFALSKIPDSIDTFFYRQDYLTEDLKALQCKYGFFCSLVVDHYTPSILVIEAIQSYNPKMLTYCLYDGQTLNYRLNGILSSSTLKPQLYPSTRVFSGPLFFIYPSPSCTLTRQRHNLLLYLGSGTRAKPLLNDLLLGLQQSAPSLPSLQIHIIDPLKLVDPDILRLPSIHSFHWYDYLTDIDRLYAQCDLAIGTPGVSHLQRSSYGLPSILMQTADNQSENLAYTCSTIRDYPVASTVSSALSSLTYLYNHDECLTQLSHDVRFLSDSLGALRSAHILSPSPKSYNLRKVRSSDIYTLYLWANDPEAMKSSARGLLPIDTHCSWFNSRNPDEFYIYESKIGLPVGYVRFDTTDARKYISYYISTDHRGLGLSRQMVCESLSLLSRLFPCQLIFARILSSNHISLRVLKSIGFVPTSAFSPSDTTLLSFQL